MRTRGCVKAPTENPEATLMQAEEEDEGREWKTKTVRGPNGNAWS